MYIFVHAYIYPFFCEAKQNGFDRKITYINKEAAISILRRYLNFKKKIFLGVRGEEMKKLKILSVPCLFRVCLWNFRHAFA